MKRGILLAALGLCGSLVASTSWAQGAPPAPGLASPSGAGVVALPAYTWAAAAGAEDYYLWVNNAAGVAVVQSWHAASSICAGATCSVSPATGLLPGAHVWWVQARNSSGSGPWSAGMGFVVGSLPAAATLVGPAGAGASTTPTYTWNAVDGVTDYYFWVNTGAGTPVVQSWLAAASICAGAVCSATPSAALAPGSHTWWVQTRNASGEGPWSAGMVFTVGELPGAATLVAPTGAGAAAGPTFSWHGVASATHYYLWVNNSAATPVVQAWHAAADVCVAESCSVVPAPALPRGAHTWWIQARNASGDGPWSAGMVFTVGDLPGAPVLRAPAGPVATASPTYSWDPLADTSEYYLWVNDASSVPVVQERFAAAPACASTPCSAKPAAALRAGGHTWWVQARNGSGDGPWSAGVSFTVVATGAVAAGGSHSLALSPERNLWSWGANWTGQLGLGSVADTPLPTQVDGVSDVVAVAGGVGHTVALRGDGSVWAAGYNGDGQLGQPGGDSAIFRPVPGLTGVVQIAAGGSHVLALRADGTVAAWGGNWSGQCGDGTFETSFVPVTVPGLVGVVAVAAGSEHSLALLADGSVVAWGAAWSGQLGDGSTEARPTPGGVPGLSGIVRIASGSSAAHSFAVGAGGVVYAWGANDQSQLGDGSSEPRSAPVLVSGLDGVIHVAAGGSHSLAVRQDGSLWSWGDNSLHQLGIDASGGLALPMMLVSPTGVVAIAAGSQHSLALTSDGRVLSWGDNGSSQAGTGEAGSPVPTPVELSGPGFQWRTIAPTITPPGGSFWNELDVTIACLTPGATIRYTTDGTEPTESSAVFVSGASLHVGVSTTLRARAWSAGLPASATTTAAFTVATAAPVATPPAGTYAGRVHAGLASQTMGAEIRYTTDGTEPGPASPLYGDLITLTENTTLKARAFRAGWQPSETMSLDYVLTAAAGSVAAGGSFSMALEPSGAIWAWGAGTQGQLGNALGLDSSDPTPVEAVSDGVGIAAGAGHALAIRADGTLAAWGLNGSGQLGTGVAGGIVLSPTLVPGLDRIVAVAAGAGHSLALRSDGRVYSWGSNALGQLGDGTTDDRAVPAVVPGLANIVAIAAGEAHSLALGADRRVWSWGDGTWGQVGDGSGTSQAVPVEVLAGAVSIAAGAHHSLAVKSDTTGWAWGRSDHGQLGVEGGGWAPAPITPSWCEPEGGCHQEPPLVDVVRLAGGDRHTLGLRGDAVVWSWGAGESGQLGRPGSDWANPPGAIEGLADVVAFAAGGQHSLAVTAAGEVWGWGRNATGAVGDGTLEDRWAPVLVAPAGFAWRLPRPTLSPAPGEYSAAVGVTLTSAVSGAAVRYTTDGSEPTEGSALVTGPVSIESSTDLRARAFKAGRNPSATAGGWYALHFGTLDPPVASPPGGTYESSAVVTLTAVPGATLWFETCPTDGSGCSEWSEYTSPVTIEKSSWLYASASKPDWSDAWTSELYTLRVAAPTVDPPGGAYAPGQRVTVTCATPGASVYYTTNGDEPTETDRQVSSGGSLPAAGFTLKLKALKAGLSPSDTSSAVYSLTGDLTAPAFAGGLSHSLALRPDGVLFAWGSNSSNQLGEIGAGVGLGPTPVSALAGVTLVAAGAFHSLAVTSDGFAWAWGADSSGQIGDGAPGASTASPGVVRALSAVTAVAAGASHSLALSGGRVWSWGGNTNGQLGTGTTTSRSEPGEVQGLTDAVAIAAGDLHSLALRADGTVVAWGSNADGALGDGTTTDRLEPVAVSGLSNVVAIAAGAGHSLAVTGEGRVFAWGLNSSAELGIGALPSQSVPVEVTGVPAVGSIAAKGNRSMALTVAGAAWSWGAGAAPALVPGLPAISQIAVGSSHSLAASADGRVWGWGGNSWRQVGDWTAVARPAPVQISEVGFAWMAGAPAASPGGGTYTAARSVSLTSGTPGAVVHFTLDGTVPTEASPAASGPVLVDRSLTLMARAYKPGLAPSAVSGAAYVLNLPALAFAPGAETYRHFVMVTVSSSVAGVSVRYTLNGGDPTESDPEAPASLTIRVDESAELRARAFKEGWGASPVRAASYVIRAPRPLDTDGDGLSDAKEAEVGSDPQNPDTNGDGLPDGAAYAAGLSVTDMDMDDDTVANPQERAAGTDPFRTDTDGDGVGDGADCFPLDPTRAGCLPPDPDDHVPPAIVLVEPLNAVLVSTNP